MPKNLLPPLLRLSFALTCGLVLPMCQSTSTTTGDASAAAPHAGPLTGAEIADKQEGVDVGKLLSMTYDEAKKVSPNSLAVPPFYKLTADEITVLRTNAKGQPERVRAKGKVFVQIDFREKLVALAQEAYIESDGEVILRGRPLLKRGRSVVEGLSETTVYYIKGTRLQVIGKHRLAKQEGGIESPHGGTIRPSFDVQPTWRRAWKDGPNPLLPALTPSVVPAEMRASPLLPPVQNSSDLPKLLVPDDDPPIPSTNGAKPLPVPPPPQ
ncbi:hypothetical protein DES53_107206 [Roseimicrobium gellanilyticum]|uniref:Lipopolysaccharide export system protein LptA n=1 Tax=Roseimicrobium gellanilyticum TaxID=748857 RepID=A0A366HFN1_9BACT|nr:hypothetical protein [Roseimicrobium gellanilyticum]RBP41374.1 hypothetical protein DES53_107206 [Roseimicrobium gellanilyticum]